MNVRNLFLMSMIVCTAPIVCAASSFAKATADRPEVSLTKQEKAALKEWVNNSIKNLPPVAQLAIKTFTSLAKDYVSFALSKMSLGKSIAHYEKEICGVDGKRFKSRAEKEFREFEAKVSSNIGPDKHEKVLSEIFKALYICPLHSWANAIFDESLVDPKGKITKVHVAAAKKFIAALSFVLKCL